MNRISHSDLMAKLGGFKSIKNMPSRNGQSKAPNQFILTFENGEVFQSYDSFIGAKIGFGLYLSRYHDYSNTTSRFCGNWCLKNVAERRKGLENGTITFVEE